MTVETKQLLVPKAESDYASRQRGAEIGYGF